MIERVVSFGPRGELVGVLAQPEPDEVDPARPAVLTWNVGVNHRVGPFRTYVDLARRLSGSGFFTFRFDASGLGDSEVRREAVLDSERELLDLRDAMDAVTRRTGASKFVLVGFCSSVDAAHSLAMLDARVAGVIHLEGYAYRTLGFKLHAVKKLFSVERHRRYAWRRLAPLSYRLRGTSPPEAKPEPVFEREFPPWADFSRDLVTLTRRGLPLLFVYAGDNDYNYKEQFWEMFGHPDIDKRQIEIHYLASADHTFFDLAARRVVIAGLERWLSERFPRTRANLDGPLDAAVGTPLAETGPQEAAGK